VRSGQCLDECEKFHLNTENGECENSAGDFDIKCNAGYGMEAKSYYYPIKVNRIWGLLENPKFCDSCLAGKYSVPNLHTYYGYLGTSCGECPAGKFSSIGAPSCNSCVAGKYSSSYAESCTSCPAGFRTPEGKGSTSCKACKWPWRSDCVWDKSEPQAQPPSSVKLAKAKDKDTLDTVTN
jgi:hypothetical protein